MSTCGGRAAGSDIRGGNMDNGDEKTDGDIRQGHPSGWVYILENDGMPHLFKIGMTTHNPNLRASELSRETGVPSPFIVGRAYFVKDRYKAEKLIHLELEPYRFRDNREFFVDYNNQNLIHPWLHFDTIIVKILLDNKLLDKCTGMSGLLGVEELFLDGVNDRKRLVNIEKELEEANKLIVRLKRTIEKLQNDTQDNDTSVLADLPKLT